VNAPDCPTRNEATTPRRLIRARGWRPGLSSGSADSAWKGPTLPCPCQRVSSTYSPRCIAVRVDPFGKANFGNQEIITYSYHTRVQGLGHQATFMLRLAAENICSRTTHTFKRIRVKFETNLYAAPPKTPPSSTLASGTWPARTSTLTSPRRSGTSWHLKRKVCNRLFTMGQGAGSRVVTRRFQAMGVQQVDSACAGVLAVLSPTNAIQGSPSTHSVAAQAAFLKEQILKPVFQLGRFKG
jgi:hypothetical protein